MVALQTMDKPVLESCETCFRLKSEAGQPSLTQWKTVCRCDRPYSPNAQYSIALCARCKKRVATAPTGIVRVPDLCTCETPEARSIVNHLTQVKPGEVEAVELDLSTVGMSPANFPTERYKPLGILGQGPRANVILARDKQRGTKVAVKCFKQVSPEALAQFEKEAKNLARLNHKNVARLIDYGILNGKTPYTVSEYKDGFNLGQYLALHGTPSHDVAVMILLAVGEALMAANKDGHFHRSLKPGNIIFIDDMNSEPAVSVTDFSLGKLKLDASATPFDAFYMSADEARGLDFDERSQLYTLGLVGFALLTAVPPFQMGSYAEIKNKHALELPPQIASLKFDAARPRDLEEVIERCLDKDPRNRFDSVAKLVERLEVFPAREKARIAAILAARKRRKLLQISAVVLGIVLVLCAIAYFVLGRH